MSTGHYEPGGHDVDGPRRDAWIPNNTGSSKASTEKAGLVSCCITMARVRRIGGAS